MHFIEPPASAQWRHHIRTI